MSAPLEFRRVGERGRQLPRGKRKYVSYQLIRNVLAAHALGLDFCTLLDARRPDLLEDWFLIVRCLRSAALRARCRVLTWQELALCLPGALKNFLSVKYGIVAIAELQPSTTALTAQDDAAKIPTRMRESGS